MIKTITALLILFSSGASIYYAVGGLVKPETALVYNNANISRQGIQVLSLFLGIGGSEGVLPKKGGVGEVLALSE